MSSFRIPVSEQVLQPQPLCYLGNRKYSIVLPCIIACDDNAFHRSTTLLAEGLALLKASLQSKTVLIDVFLDCGNAQIGTVVAEPEEDEREFGAQQPHLHRREYGLGNGMYYFVIAAAAVTCSKPLPQTAETLQLRHLQRKQAVCRNAGLKTRSRFPRNSSVESMTQ
ncbi:hypothetical protein ACLOJK_016604 [Asimina triloba]